MKTKKLISFLAGMLMSIVAYGQYVGMTFTANTVEGVEMTFSVTSTTDKTVQVGEGGYYSPAIDRSTTGSITIPATVSYGGVTYQVTSIGGSAFRGCSSLTSVGDLSSYTSIAYYAFEDCTSLTSVGDLSSCTSIGEQAFCGCTSLTSVGDLSSCTSIETNTFRGCSMLTTVGDLSSCTSIGTYAFLECFSLSSVGDISSCTSIGNSAFQDCYSLTSFTFPNSVTNIGNHAFDHCTGLTSITIPKSVTSIGEFAFFRCNSLTSVTVLVSQPLPIIESTFSNHANATLYVPVGSKAAYEAADYWKDFNEIIDMGQSIAFEDAAVKAICVTNWDTNSDGELSYAEAAAVTDLGEVFKSNQTITSFDELRYFTGLKNICNLAFYSCVNLTSTAIPNNVTSIDKSAFYGCTGLITIDIPEGVTTFGGNAFWGCKALTSIIIPNSVTSIGVNAFYGCSGLASIIIPNSVASIGADAFEYCYGLKSIVVEEGNTVYDSRDNCNAIIETASKTLITGCNNSVIPEGITSIGNHAFTYCDGLTSVAISNSVTTIGQSAFTGCGGLTSITIGNSVSSIGTSAFSWCSGLTSIMIGNSVTSIGAGAFFACSSLTTVTLTNSITTISEDAFRNCGGLTHVKSEIEEPFAFGDNAFYNISDNCVLIVPDGTRDAYIAAGWTEDVFKGGIVELSSNIIFADANVKNICVANWDTNSDGELSYAEAAAVTDLGEVFQSNHTIKSFDELRYFTSLESISNSAFGGCSGLTSITIGNSVTSIGDYAFWDCSGLTSITIPRSVVSIGYIAFRGCTGLYSINVEAGNTKYDSHDNSNAIIETESNTLITGCQNTIIPNNVTKIGEFAFYGCTGLNSNTIPNSVISIGEGAFQNCSGLTSITIGNSVTSIGHSAFYGCSGLTNITIPNSVTYIGGDAFKNSGWYDAQSDGILYLDNWLIFYKGSEPIKEIIIKNGTKGLASYAFSSCNDLTSITIPNNVSFIGDGVFCGCSKLNSITIPNGVTSIGKCLFSDCFGLTSITIPNSVTSIDDQAFENCRSLTSITIPNGVTSIGYQAFSGCSGLTSITIPNHVTSIGFWAFNGCSGLSSFEIPNSVTSIGDSAFGNCYFATSNFVNYSSLTSSDTWGATLCDEETSDGLLIKNNSVIKCRTWVTSATIPNSVISIGSNAFQTCSALTSITIPNSVTTIGNRAFIGCSDLSSVISKIEEPFVFGSSAFFNISNNCVLKVPVGTRDAYIAAGWTEDVFKGGVVEMPEEDTDISGMDNVIYIEPTEGREGDIVSLEVKLKNSITPVGCSFKLKLPEGFSLVKDSDGDVIYELSDRTKKMSVTMQDWNNGSYDFALTPSTGTATISGNDGSIVTLRIQVPEEVAPGDYKIKLTNNLIQSKVSGTTQDNALPDVKTTFTVEDYIMGDVNGDKNVTPADAIMILYHYFNVEQNGFIVKAADLNKDGNITPADAIEALYLYFGVGNSNAVRSFIETLDPQ